MLRFVAALLMAVVAGSCGRTDPEQGRASTTASVPAAAERDSGGQTGAVVATAKLPLSGAARKNKHLQLEVYEAGFDPRAPAPPPGLRYFTVGLRGIALMRAANVEIPIQGYVFAQNERGCISRPAPNATWLTQPFGEVAMFTAEKPTRGDLSFLVPDDTEHVRILIAPAGRGLAVAAGDEFEPSWPEPVRTIEDGSALRVQVLPIPPPPDLHSVPTAGLERVVLDFLIENLSDEQGIEFTTSQQLRLVDPAGNFIQPAQSTKELGCRLDDLDVVPPGQVRRFMVAYDVPAGAPKRLQYRGFEVDEVTVDLP